MVNVTIIGNLGKDPELTTNGNGKKIARFSVASTSKAYKTLDGREEPAKTQWYSCTAWEGNATYASYLKKGYKVYIQGDITGVYTYDKDGKSVSSIDVTVKYIENLTPRSEGSAPTQSSPTPNQPESNDEQLPF